MHCRTSWSFFRDRDDFPCWFPTEFLELTGRVHSTRAPKGMIRRILDEIERMSGPSQQVDPVPTSPPPGKAPWTPRWPCFSQGLEISMWEAKWPQRLLPIDLRWRIPRATGGLPINTCARCSMIRQPLRLPVGSRISSGDFVTIEPMRSASAVINMTELGNEVLQRPMRLGVTHALLYFRRGERS